MSRRTLVLAPVLLLLWLACLSGCASAPPREGGAGVVLARQDRVYVALGDSLRPVEGDSLEFLQNGNRIASGVITSVTGTDLASVQLTSGSLRDVRRLERLRVATARAFPAPRTLRVGLPGPDRGNLLFACPDLSIAPPAPAGTYAQNRLSERVYRLASVAGAMDRGRRRPDTLLVWLFSESTDEEIALERGELDVAVFWPGEVSSHIREQPRWRGFPYGTRTRGVLAAVPPSGAPAGWDSIGAAAFERLQALNAGVFRGDLLPYSSIAGGTRQPAAEPVPGRSAADFEVDRACPGWRLMERELGRGAPSERSGTRVNRIRLRFLDALTREPRTLRDSLHVVPLFAVRCPVVCAPELRPLVRSIGVDRLADMPDCRRGGREP